MVKFDESVSGLCVDENGFNPTLSEFVPIKTNGLDTSDEIEGGDVTVNGVSNPKKKFSLVTLFKRVNRKAVPRSSGDNTDKNIEPVRIFVGSWNMAFKKITQKDFLKHFECTCLISQNCKCASQFNDPLKDWLELDYDIYFITLQESVSPNFFKIISKYLTKSSKNLVKIKLKNDRIMGFGEGAYVSRKMTSISVWISKKLLDDGSVKVGCSRPVYISSYNRSKGVVCFQLKIFDQILCLVGCHMPSDYLERQKAFTTVLEKLSGLFGDNESLTFKDVFHHVIWAGDFNYKLMIALEKVMENIQNGTLKALMRYDEFYLPSSPLRDAKFYEDDIEFDPTYKKKENRNVLNKDDENWFMNEYAITDIKWYHNYNTERIPAWTDRILKWSDESMEYCLRIEPQTYKPAIPTKKTILLNSDHTPISCGFCLRPVSKTLVPPVKLNVHTFKSYS